MKVGSAENLCCLQPDLNSRNNKSRGLIAKSNAMPRIVPADIHENLHCPTRNKISERRPAPPSQLKTILSNLLNARDSREGIQLPAPRAATARSRTMRTGLRMWAHMI